MPICNGGIFTAPDTVIVVDDGTRARAHSVNECAPCQRDDLHQRCSKGVWVETVTYKDFRTCE